MCKIGELGVKCGVWTKRRKMLHPFFYHNVLTIPCRRRISDFYNKMLDRNLFLSLSFKNISFPQIKNLFLHFSIKRHHVSFGKHKCLQIELKKRENYYFILGESLNCYRNNKCQWYTMPRCFTPEILVPSSCFILLWWCKSNCRVSLIVRLSWS